MDQFELRLECLKLAKDLGGSPTNVVDAAREMASFVEGTDDAKIVRAAPEFQNKVAN